MIKTEALIITARYHRSITDLIELSKFDRHSGVSDENFPENIESEKSLEIFLMDFGALITAEAAEVEMLLLGLRPGTVKELLSVAIDYPDKQRELPIVATGSTYRNSDGRCRVAYIYGGENSRDLGLDWRGGYGFRGRCLFLAVREV